MFRPGLGAHSAGVHTCHTLDCMKLVGVLLTWHSTLYNRRPFTPKPHASIDYFGRVGQDNRMNIRYLLQLPLKLTLSARYLNCLFAVLPLCTGALGITASF
jgi:hypothetical protein